MAGFRRFEMGATITGIRLYERRGYVAVDRAAVPLPGGAVFTPHFPAASAAHSASETPGTAPPTNPNH